MSTVSPPRREAATRSESVAHACSATRRRVPESLHVAEIGLDTATDREIWEYAAQRGYVIVSKDTDFRQLALVFGPPPHVVWLRVGNVSTGVIEALLRRSVARLQEFAASDEESLLVLSPVV